MTDATALIPIGDIERMAKAIADSGLFGMKTPAQALALMLIAHAEGRHPALAARDYDIIQGRPAKKAEAMLRDFLQGGGKVEWEEMTDKCARANFSHPQGGTVMIEWTFEMASKIKSWSKEKQRLAALTEKDNWQNYPRQMLRSRVISEGVRAIYPLATSGMYVTDEVRDMEPKQPPRDITPKPAQAKPAQAKPARANGVYDPETGEVVDAGDPGEPPTTMVYSRDWQIVGDEVLGLLATAKTMEKFAEFWEMTAAEERAELTAHAPDEYARVVAGMKTLHADLKKKLKETPK